MIPYIKINLMLIYFYRTITVCLDSIDILSHQLLERDSSNCHYTDYEQRGI